MNKSSRSGHDWRTVFFARCFCTLCELYSHGEKFAEQCAPRRILNFIRLLPHECIGKPVTALTSAKPVKGNIYCRFTLLPRFWKGDGQHMTNMEGFHSFEIDFVVTS